MRGPDVTVLSLARARAYWRRRPSSWRVLPARNAAMRWPGCQCAVTDSDSELELETACPVALRRAAALGPWPASESESGRVTQAATLTGRAVRVRRHGHWPRAGLPG